MNRAAVARAFEFRIKVTERLGRNLCERIAGGGYPAALARPPGLRQVAWYNDYAYQMQADMFDFSRISKPGLLPQLLASCAAQTAACSICQVWPHRFSSAGRP